MSKRFPQERYPLPIDVNPPTTVCFQIEVPNDIYHLAAFRGAIFSLAKPYNWEDDIAHTAILAGARWMQIFDALKPGCPKPDFGSASMEVEDFMPLRIDCNCNVFITCCDGTEKQLLTSDQVKALLVSQPGQGTPQPPSGGGTQCYPVTLQANGKLLIPVAVNTGDVITITSATGAGNDGTVSPWECIDGNTFFAGVCLGGTTGVSGGDPLPLSPHMSLIINVNGTFYPMISPFTVPGGVVNVQPYLQINDSVLTDNAGSYELTVCVQNNQAAVWTHIFDFTHDIGGWTIFPGEGGHYVPGIGWMSDSTGVATEMVYIQRILPTLPAGGTYSSYSIDVTAAVGAASNICVDLVCDTPAVVVGANHLVCTKPIANPDTIDSQIYRTPNTIGSGNYIITRATISGVGHDPF